MQTTEIIEEFAAGYSFEFDQYQREACTQLIEGQAVLLAAPTGAGKTVVGECAVWLALRQGSKCFYTTPIKALSNQKYHDLLARYSEENVGLLTGDVSINPSAPIIVMTTEVLRNMIYASSSTLLGLSHVVLDEIHYLADRSRGAVWEEVILGLAESVTIVGLSATVSNAEEFGDWLSEVRGDVCVVVSEKRPVPLFQHVMAGSQIYDMFDDNRKPNPQLLSIAKSEARDMRDDSRRPRGRDGRGKRKVSYGSGRFGGAASLDRNRDHRRRLQPSRMTMVRVLDRADLLPAIVFIFSRAGCDAAVKQLVDSQIRLTSAREAETLRAIAEKHVRALSPTDLLAAGYQEFLDGLLKGVAAHHAGLLPAFKNIVEEGFESGLIKVVFATETLALGINMPARCVVIDKLVKYNGEAHVDLTPGEFTQLTGRAGRRGIDVEGHAVVVWQPGMDPRAVAGLAGTRTYPLRSSFSPSYNMAVNLVNTVGQQRARVLLELSFAQFQIDRSVVASARAAAKTSDDIAGLLESAQCDQGDFTEYATMRAEISRLENEHAKLRRSYRVEAIAESLIALDPGDVIWVDSRTFTGWAVVIRPARSRDAGALVIADNHKPYNLSPQSLSAAVTVAGRIRIPKRFDIRSKTDRKNVAASLDARIISLDRQDNRVDRGKGSAALEAEITRLRRKLRDHPCHSCPDRETHARFAERAMRLMRDKGRLQRRNETRHKSIGTKFDRICSVLVALGYLDQDADRVTDAGVMLSRIYCPHDLLVCESVRAGIYRDLDAPQLAAVLSTMVYESRAGGLTTSARMPDPDSAHAMSRIRSLWLELSQLERDHRIDRQPAPDLGFAEAAHAWCSGQSLASVLADSAMSAGDFVRWVRQVIDLANQIAGAVNATDVQLAQRCREVVASMLREVVDSRTD